MRPYSSGICPAGSPCEHSLVALLIGRYHPVVYIICQKYPPEAETIGFRLLEKGGVNMDPAFILLSLWFLGAAVEFIKDDD